MPFFAGPGGDVFKHHEVVFEVGLSKHRRSTSKKKEEDFEPQVGGCILQTAHSGQVLRLELVEGQILLGVAELEQGDEKVGFEGVGAICPVLEPDAEGPAECLVAFCALAFSSASQGLDGVPEVELDVNQIPVLVLGLDPIPGRVLLEVGAGSTAGEIGIGGLVTVSWLVGCRSHGVVGRDQEMRRWRMVWVQ